MTRQTKEERRAIELAAAKNDRVAMMLRRYLDDGMEKLAGYYPELIDTAIAVSREELQRKRNEKKPVTLQLLRMLPQLLDRLKQVEPEPEKENPIDRVLKRLEKAQGVILTERRIETTGTESLKTEV